MEGDRIWLTQARTPPVAKTENRQHDHGEPTRHKYELPLSPRHAVSEPLLTKPLPLPVNLDTLEPQQLSQVKKQLDEELEHLTSSFAQLHGATNKFKDCLRCVQTRSTAPECAPTPPNELARDINLRPGANE